MVLPEDISQYDTTTTSSDRRVHPDELNVTIRPRNEDEIFSAMNITPRPRRRQDQAPENQANLLPAQLGDRSNNDINLHPPTGVNSDTRRTDSPVNSHYTNEEVFSAMNITPRPRRIQGQAPENQASLLPAQLGDRDNGDIYLHLATGGNSDRTDSPANSRHRASFQSHHLAHLAPAQQGSYTGQTQSTSMALEEWMSPATTGAASASARHAPSSSPCHKCRQNPAKIIFLPCGHLVCEGCARGESCCSVCGEAVQATRA